MTDEKLTEVATECFDMMTKNTDTYQDLLKILMRIYHAVGVNFVKEGAIKADTLIEAQNKIFEVIHADWKAEQ